MADTLREYLHNRLEALRLERQTFIPHYQELTDFINPSSGRYVVIDTNKGSKKHNNIINSCASIAHRTLKSGMHAGMTSQNRPWFRLTIQEDPELMEFGSVKQWLYDVENIMRVVFSRSNFYNIMPTVYGGAALHATACISLLEDPNTFIRLYQFPTGSYFLALNDRLKIDTFYREFAMTVRQMVQKFGIDKVSTHIKEQFNKGNYDALYEVCQAVEPNPERDLGKITAKNKAWRSVYWEKNNQEQAVLSESGYNEFPIIAPRWDVEGDDVYGTSCPGIEALGHIKGLQFTEKRKAEALDKLVRPPMVADSTLRGQQTSIIASGITYIDNLAQQAHAGFRPVYQFNPNIEEIRADISEIKEEIRRIFFEDLMMMFATSDVNNVTAREVEERHQEKLLVLGPTIERFGEELYDPSIDRAFKILWRRGMIPQPPPEMQGYQIKVEYISVMAQAQKLVGTASMERVGGFAGNLATLNQSVLDKLNMDNMVDEYANMHGIPPNCINSDDQVQAIRAERQQQQQQQQMAEQAPVMSQAATAAKTLSETDVEQTSALTRLLGLA